MKIGITGQGGFIGSNVAQALLHESYEVVSLDKYTRSCAADNRVLNECPDDLNWVLHFAASASIGKSFDNPFYTYANNLESTIVALNIAYRSRSPFLFMSSYVYGKPRYLPIDEKHPVDFVNPYMGSKIIGEEICRQICSMLLIPLIVLRGFNIYGNCKIPGRLISDLLESAHNRMPIVLNDPLPKRDYLYIKDFQLLILKIISQNPVKTGTYNVGYGHSYSNLEVAEMVRMLAGSKNTVTVQSHPRPQDILDCTVNVNLVKETFSWLPIYSLEMGLSELLKLNQQQ
ncbi:MAG TPA: NAD-dependent epimerase/dehydratase family protein [Candidatus Wujingus californicus]|uniref:NAD-dependent epimerase/dehydratase family protein n=1 Tax=Candidatus Wujingus californicus TaxID=3367618 RepID=UPI001D55FA62|nr:NAD(P)-dependent oxidoreductase [Planctomycetota bacterium]